MHTALLGILSGTSLQDLLVKAESKRAAQQLAVLETSQRASQKGNNYPFHLHLLITSAGTHSIDPAHFRFPMGSSAHDETMTILKTGTLHTEGFLQGHQKAYVYMFVISNLVNMLMQLTSELAQQECTGASTKFPDIFQKRLSDNDSTWSQGG